MMNMDKPSTAQVQPLSSDEERLMHAWDAFAKRYNPMFSGPFADLLSMVPFVLLIGLLYWVARKQHAGPKL